MGLKDIRVRPNFFLIGTTKGGTSTLYLWLCQHPDIAMASPKELHYFCHCPNPKLHVAKDFSAYLTYFRSAQIVGEASPCYLYYPGTPEAVQDFSPDAKILISLRDPVDRFWSHYLMNEVYRSNGLRPETAFERYRNHTRDDAINDLVGVGLYGEQTSRWYRSFRGDQIHVTFLESMVAEPEAVWDDLSGFLGLRGAAIDISVRDKEYVEPRGAVGRIALRRPTVRKIGVALIPARARRTLKTRILGSTADKPVLSPDLRDSLRDYYRADCLRLEQVIERQLPWDWHHA